MKLYNTFLFFIILVDFNCCLAMQRQLSDQERCSPDAQFVIEEINRRKNVLLSLVTEEKNFTMFLALIEGWVDTSIANFNQMGFGLLADFLAQKEESWVAKISQPSNAENVYKRNELVVDFVERQFVATILAFVRESEMLCRALEKFFKQDKKN